MINMSMIYHVSKAGSDTNVGSETSPFVTIGAAAAIAQPGDTIIVHEGEYREWVNPEYGGLSHLRRITYQAAEGEQVVIKGSERMQSWENLDGTVWKVTLPNAFFGEYNPYAKTIAGDWMIYPVGRSVHLGDVYLNGMSFYEAENLDAVHHATTSTTILDHWTDETVAIKNIEQTKYRWFSTVDDANTTLYANFHGADPNQELVEINVRKCCFYPKKTGVNYLTVRGFEMAHAATPWSPPTGDQPGMLGAHWSKGWIIENNLLHDSKCSAISIGKEASTGDNFCTFRKDKPGYQYQLESVFAARKIGWSKETIGSHIIRNNTIYDCGQNGIVGHLGCVFSEIYNNHIYNIALKREFYGHEIAGIKLHAAIDVQLRHNHIHDCSLGIWLDWQAQGTRVSKNLLYHNNRDLFIEVTHGPCVVDHNILGSKYALDNHAQGSAFVHNLVAGKTVLKKMLNRATPYHTPHSTEVTGYAMVYGADDRVYNNIFVGGAAPDGVGTALYDGCTTSLEEYIAAVDANKPGDLGLFEGVEQPAYVSHNSYFNGAKAFQKESVSLQLPDFDPAFSIEDDGEECYLNITLPDDFDALNAPLQSTATLGRVRIVDAEFEHPDGTPLQLDSDYLDEIRQDGTPSGPLACLKSGHNRIKIVSVK